MGVRPTNVTVDNESGRTWAYAFTDKFILSGDGWIQRRIGKGMDNAGHKHAILKFKSDHQTNIVAIQHEVQRLRVS